MVNPMAIKVDISKMKLAHASVRQALPAARVGLIRQYAASIVRNLATISPRDTNRYVRGWIIAGKQVGIHNIPLPVIKSSKYKEEYLGRLAEQVERFQSEVEAAEVLIDAWYHRKNRRRVGYYNTLLAKKTKAEHRLARAREEYEKFVRRDSSIVMGVGINTSKTRNGTRGRGSWVKSGGRRLSITVRDRVYGGNGRLIIRPDQAVLILSNLEPHSRIVERKRRVLAQADAAARLAGLRKLDAGYAKALAYGAAAASRGI